MERSGTAETRPEFGGAELPPPGQATPKTGTKTWGYDPVACIHEPQQPRSHFLKARTTKRGGVGLPNRMMDSTHCFSSSCVQVLCATSIGLTPLS
eukprot:5398088-Alexandrium_andersonii.AAC.1